MSKSFRQFKKNDFGLREPERVQLTFNIYEQNQPINTRGTRRYIADKILNDRKLNQDNA